MYVKAPISGPGMLQLTIIFWEAVPKCPCNLIKHKQKKPYCSCMNHRLKCDATNTSSASCSVYFTFQKAVFMASNAAVYHSFSIHLTPADFYNFTRVLLSHSKTVKSWSSFIFRYWLYKKGLFIQCCFYIKPEKSSL